MNGFTIFMLTLVVVGLPVAGGIASQMFKRWLQHKEHMAVALTAATAERAAQYAAQIERLEQRVRVLERIATDQGMALSAEIEQLREQPLN